MNFDTSIAVFGQGGGRLSGTGTLVVSGETTLLGGGQWGPGTSQFDGAVLITGSGHRELGGGRIMNTSGVTTWSGNTGANTNGIGITSGGGTINNSGTWNDSNAFDARLGEGLSGTKVFNNAGAYNKLGDSTTRFLAAFNNTGVLNVSSGVVGLLAGGTGTGQFHIAEGSVLSVGLGGSSSGQYLFDGVDFSGTGELQVSASSLSEVDARFAGDLSHAGRFVVSSGTAQIDGSLSVPSYLQTGGSLSGAGTLVVSGETTLLGGGQWGPGTSQFDGAVLITGSGHRELGGGRIMNTSGVTTWSGNTGANTNGIGITSGGGTINNSGTWNDSNAFDARLGEGLSGTKVFNNAGAYNKLGDSTTQFQALFNNTGSLLVHDGVAAFNSGLNNTGTLAGNGVVRLPAGGLLNAGEIAPGIDGVGGLTLEGSLTLGSGSLLSFELASLNSFDQLWVSGALVGFDGALNILSLGYAPTVGDAFVIMTFASTMGGATFSDVRWAGFGSGVKFDVLYMPDHVMLTVAAVPEPETYAMLLAGLGLIGFVASRRKVH